MRKRFIVLTVLSFCLCMVSFVQATGSDTPRTKGDILCEAAKNGNLLEVRDFIVDAGLNPDLKDKNGWTALMWASHKGYTDIVAFLLDKIELKPQDGLALIRYFPMDLLKKICVDNDVFYALEEMRKNNEKKPLPFPEDAKWEGSSYTGAVLVAQNTDLLETVLHALEPVYSAFEKMMASQDTSLDDKIRLLKESGWTDQEWEACRAFLADQYGLIA